MHHRIQIKITARKKSQTRESGGNLVLIKWEAAIKCETLYCICSVRPPLKVRKNTAASLIDNWSYFWLGVNWELQSFKLEEPTTVSEEPLANYSIEPTVVMRLKTLEVVKKLELNKLQLSSNQNENHICLLGTLSPNSVRWSWFWHGWVPDLLKNIYLWHLRNSRPFEGWFPAPNLEYIPPYIWTYIQTYMDRVHKGHTIRRRNARLQPI